MSSAAARARGHATCPCCQQPDRPMVCAPCTATSLRARRWTLRRLKGAHTQARLELETALGTGNTNTGSFGDRPTDGQRDGQKHGSPNTERPRVSLVDLSLRREALARNKLELGRLRVEVANRETQVDTENEASTSRRETLTASVEKLNHAKTTLFSPTRETAAGNFPAQQRAYALKAKGMEDQLLVQRCAKLSELARLLPIVAERPEVTDRNGGGNRGRGFVKGKSAPYESTKHKVDTDNAPTAVRICGYRVPDPGDGCEFSAEELGSGLGGVLLFLNVACQILDAPALLRSAGAGSSRATVWQPSGFWDDGSAGGAPSDGGPGFNPTGGALPLFLPRNVVEANGGGDAGASPHERNRDEALVETSSPRKNDSTNPGALGALLLETVNSGVCRIKALQKTKSFGADDRDDANHKFASPAVLAKHRRDLRNAVSLLHKAVGVVCVELSFQLGGVSAPGNYGPLASLAFYAQHATRTARGNREAKREGDGGQNSTPNTKHAKADASNPFRDLRNPDLLGEGVSSGASGETRTHKKEKVGKKKQIRKALGALAASGVTGAGHVGVMGQSLMTSVFGAKTQSAKKTSKEHRKGPTETWASDASVMDLAADGWDLVDVPGRKKNGAVGAVDRPNSLRQTHAAEREKQKARPPAMLPPPPSRPEDVEHWTRAMYVDARR